MNSINKFIFQYAPKELMEVYRDEVFHVADVLVPNAFELRFVFPYLNNFFKNF